MQRSAQNTRGFSSATLNSALEAEQVAGRIVGLLQELGYQPIELPSIITAKAADNSAFRFVDSDGELLQLRSDATPLVSEIASSILNSNKEAGVATNPLKLRYQTSVWRDTPALSGQSRQSEQIGVECIGSDNKDDMINVVKTLQNALAVTKIDKAKLTFVIKQPENSKKATSKLEFALTNALGASKRLLMSYSPSAGEIHDYYDSLIFEVYAGGFPKALAQGGLYQVQRLDGKKTVSVPAVGWAINFTDYLNYLSLQQGKLGEVNYTENSIKCRFAIPKGSLNDGAIKWLKQRKLLSNEKKLLKTFAARTLRYYDEGTGVEFWLLRASDIPLFVNSGGVDAGICGLDTISEGGLDVVEQADLKFGACQFVEAWPQSTIAELGGGRVGRKVTRPQRTNLRVATKYPRVTARWLEQSGRHADIVKVSGNIEVAPYCGLADCIVDITASGATLRENDLVATDVICTSTARLVVNRSYYFTNSFLMEVK